MTSEQHVHVFIGGVHRSGTTLVGRLLAEHDGASGFADTGVPADEGQHLQSVYAPARAFGDPVGSRSQRTLRSPRRRRFYAAPASG